MPQVTVPPCEHPRVSVLVLGFRRPSLPEAVEAVVRTTHATSFEVRILLNGATPEVHAAVTSGIAGVPVDVAPANLGFAGGVNRLAAGARGEFLALVNDDARAQDGWLDHLVQAADELPDAAMITSRLLFPDGTLQEAGARITPDGVPYSAGADTDGTDPRYRRRRDVDFGAGAGLLIRRAPFESLGGLDERFYPAYYEDLDLALRLRAAGWRAVYEPSAVMEHDKWGSTGAGERNSAAAYTRTLFDARWSEVFTGPPQDPFTLPDEPLVAVPGRFAIAVTKPEVDPAQRYAEWLATELAASRDREQAAGQRERAAAERERAAGERERAAGERERAAYEREQAAQREVAALRAELDRVATTPGLTKRALDEARRRFTR